MGRKQKRNKHASLDSIIHSKHVSKDYVTHTTPRYLVLTKERPLQTMTDVPTSLLSNVINNVAGKVNSIKKLNNGTVLIETKSEAQSTKLMKLKYFPPKVPVKVTPHRGLNYSKGVIKCWHLADLSIEEIRNELKSQSVINVEPLYAKYENKDCKGIHNKCTRYTLTFSLSTLPQSVNIGCLVLNPIPYVPQPKMCYRCYKYGHIAKYCKFKEQLCANCMKPGHVSEDCTSSPTCANCPENKTPGHPVCLGYMIHRKVMEIESILKNVYLGD